MKAPTSLLAVLLMLSSTSLAQTASSQLMAQVQPTAPTQQAVAGDEPSKPDAARPEAESQASTPSPTASTPSTEAAAASADVVPAAPFAPPFSPAPFAAGAKLFLEPMDGFEQLLARAILKKKVPVVVVKERAKADFVMSGDAHVKRPGFLTGMVLSTHGGGNISIKDARTGNQVFAYKFNRVDQGLAEGYIYEGWANACAKHLKKALEKK